MNEILNKFLLAEINLRQPGFTCNARGPFAKSKDRIQKLKETGD